MIEFLIVILGVVALWKFSRSINAIAEGASQQAQGWAEEQIIDAQKERQGRWKDFKSEVNTDDIVSHDDICRELKIK